MQIILDQDEIMTAIEAYVHGQVSINDNQEISIDLKAGRGENGFSATLDIRAKAVEPEQTSAPKRKPATRSTKTTPPVEPETTPTEPTDPAPGTIAFDEPAAETAPTKPVVNTMFQTPAKAPETTETAEAPALKPTTSIFGGATKPANSIFGAAVTAAE